MTKILQFLSQRKILTACIAAVYFLCVVLPHDFVGARIHALLFNGSIPDYNRSFLLIASIGVALILPGIIRKLWRSEARVLRLIYLGSLLLLMLASYFTIMVLATETIHWPQYAVMAILIYPLTGRIGDTLIWTTLLGAADEGWQYFMLSSSDYYDFNDVILNFIGAAMGAWIISLYAKEVAAPKRKLLFSPATLSFTLLFSLGIIALMGDVIMLYGVPDNRFAITLSPERHESFWSAFHQFKYHIVRPWEALVILILLYHFYVFMFKKITVFELTPDPSLPREGNPQP